MYEHLQKTGLDVIVIKLEIKIHDYNYVESNLPFLRVWLLTMKMFCFKRNKSEQQSPV